MRGMGRLLTLAAVLVLLVGLGMMLSSTQESPVSQGVPTGTTAASAPTGTTAASAPAVDGSGLEAVAASSLPQEARETLDLIARGGPYPYSRDGAVFSNFERLLPRKPSGYYKEFTVRTPGESDRGARRIVVGETGEKYYTPDHYESFLQILEGK